MCVCVCVCLFVGVSLFICVTVVLQISYFSSKSSNVNYSIPIWEAKESLLEGEIVCYVFKTGV